MVALLISQFGAGVASGARIVFWLAAFLLFYVYAGYPLLLALIGLFVRRPRTDLGYTPRISVLIAAYNEEEAIERKIQQTLALEYPADKIEVLVLSDCSTDRTDEIVKTFPDSPRTPGQNAGASRKNLCAERRREGSHRRGHHLF